MKRDRLNGGWIAAIVLLGVNPTIVLWPAQGPSSAQEVKRFVYTVVDVPGDTQTLQATLNEYGAAGWDLAAVAIGDIQVPRVIFKKQP